MPWYLRCSSRPRSMLGSRISQGRSANITIWAPILAAESIESSLEATGIDAPIERSTAGRGRISMRGCL